MLISANTKKKRYIAFSAPKSPAYAYTLVKIKSNSIELTAVNPMHSENMGVLLECDSRPFKSLVPISESYLLSCVGPTILWLCLSLQCILPPILMGIL